MIIAYLAMLILPGLMGNKWRNNRLRKQGYEFVDSIKANSPKGAIEQVTENYLQVLETTNISEMMIAKSILESADIPYKVAGESLNTMGLLAGPAKLFVPANENDKASQLLRQVEV
jgi:hypothetical protein